MKKFKYNSKEEKNRRPTNLKPPLEIDPQIQKQQDEIVTQYPTECCIWENYFHKEHLPKNISRYI